MKWVNDEVVNVYGIDRMEEVFSEASQNFTNLVNSVDQSNL